MCDDYDITKAYSMVEGLEQLDKDMKEMADEIETDLIPYFSITENIREELTTYIGIDEGRRLQDLLLDKEFDKAYDFLEEQWDESVQETVSEDEIEEWDPENTLQA